MNSDLRSDVSNVPGRLNELTLGGLPVKFCEVPLGDLLVDFCKSIQGDVLWGLYELPLRRLLNVSLGELLRRLPSRLMRYPGGLPTGFHKVPLKRLPLGIFKSMSKGTPYGAS